MSELTCGITNRFPLKKSVTSLENTDGRLKTMAKRKIYDPNKLFEPYHNHSGISFALLGRYGRGGRGLCQATKTFTCRDYLHDSVQALLHGRDTNGGGCNYKRTKNPEIITDEFRLFVCLSGKDMATRLRILTAKKIINAYEDLARFPTRMKLASIDHESKYFKGGGWLLSGDRRWISHAQLMSMVTLICRCCTVRFRDLPDEVINSVDAAEKYMKRELAKRHSSHSDISSYLPNALKVMRPMMERFDEIFNLPMEDAYPRSPERSWHSAGGINELSLARTGIDHLDDKIREIIKGSRKAKAC